VKGMRVFFAGEGRTELGGWADSEPYREPVPRPGVLQHWAARVANIAITPVGGVCWKDIPMLKPGGHRGHEQRRVAALAVLGKENGAELVVFSRDRDRDLDRAKTVDQGIEEANRLGGARVTGGLAIEAIESWVLAAKGERHTEHHARPKERLAQVHGIADVESMVAAIGEADLGCLPDDALSLAEWIRRVQAATPE
jgi:hypothetical protein